jgi:hypothetical protein
MSIRTNVSIDFRGVAPKIDKITQAKQVKADEIVLKDTNFFIPRDSGNLEDSSRLASRIGEGKLIWDTPYARRLYWNPQFNFSKDSNPNARGKWFEEAKALNLNQWLRILQRM